MTDFHTWRHENLVQFATEAVQRMKFLQEEVEALNADIKAAIAAYRELNKTIHQ
jgi:hypothetical protein